MFLIIIEGEKMVTLYIVFFILTLALVVITARKYWRGWPTRLEDKVERLDKRLEDPCSLSLLEGGLSHEEKEASG
jgi:hypothetical protein